MVDMNGWVNGGRCGWLSDSHDVEVRGTQGLSCECNAKTYEGGTNGRTKGKGKVEKGE